jgi:hypothetical protein
VNAPLTASLAVAGLLAGWGQRAIISRADRVLVLGGGGRVGTAWMAGLLLGRTGQEAADLVRAVLLN